MNKELEALETLLDLLSENYAFKQEKMEAEEVLEKSLERNVAKKPKEDFMLHCPNCEEQLMTNQENYNYCIHCGQRLDWS